MQIRKVGETDTTITLGWDPVAGADGYRFYSAGVLRSRSMDPKRRTVKFSKGQEPYKIEAVQLTPIDTGTWPSTPPPPQVAPRTYNKVPSADARFCVAGLPRDHRGLYVDAFSAYDENGLDVDGGRSRDTQVPGLKPANEMDGRGACDPYNSFPPWPPGSYQR